MKKDEISISEVLANTYLPYSYGVKVLANMDINAIPAVADSTFAGKKKSVSLKKFFSISFLSYI